MKILMSVHHTNIITRMCKLWVEQIYKYAFSAILCTNIVHKMAENSTTYIIYWGSHVYTCTYCMWNSVSKLYIIIVRRNGSCIAGLS